MCLPLFCVADNNYCILANSTSLSGPSRGGELQNNFLGIVKSYIKIPWSGMIFISGVLKGLDFYHQFVSMFQKTGLSDKQVNIFLVYMVSTLSYVL